MGLLLYFVISGHAPDWVGETDRCQIVDERAPAPVAQRAAEKRAQLCCVEAVGVEVGQGVSVGQNLEIISQLGEGEG